MMKTLGLALRAFFRVLRDARFAEQARGWLLEGAPADGGGDAVSAATPAAPTQVEAKRSAALTLVSTLQREARFLDFVMESLDAYDDSQVGAAARDVQRDLGSVVRRIFAPEPLRSEAEGSSLQVPAGFDPGRFRLTGDVAGEPPYSGTLQHHGWQAGQCEMPAWSGDAEAAMVLAPAEVEVQG
ncbi:MAG: DUF2760 domain-containing protein [Acidobacteriota bacterium]